MAIATIVLAALIIICIIIYILVDEQYNMNYSLLEQEKNIEIQRNLVVEKNREISFQKNEITSSIESAKRIQQALLPSRDLLKKHLKQYFLFYKPRDIVSGDFYWVSKIKNKIIVAVGDCTGHGVPGAFVSLLGISFLNDIVIKEHKLSPNIILDILRDRIITSMNQIEDGMDISLVVIDEKNKCLEFSGANNSCIIIRNEELIELKGDLMPIGKMVERNGLFTNHKINLEKGDNIYCFSDGIVDQFGGQHGKKLKTKYFIEVLMKMKDKEIEDQYIFLEEFFNYWIQGYEQIDDISVLGIKI